jgi:hypothetical protein
MPKRRRLKPNLAAFSAEPDWDCWLDPPANPFGGAFPVAPAVIAPATWVADLAASQLVQAVAEVGQAYPAARQNLPALPELLRRRPGSPLEVAAVFVFPLPLRVCSSRSE